MNPAEKKKKGLIEAAAAPDDEASEAAPDNEQAEGESPDNEKTEATPDNEQPEGEAGGQGGSSPAQRVAIAAKRIVYDPKAGKELVKIIQSAPDPIQGIAQACLMVLRILHTNMKGAQGMGAVAIGAVVPMVIELAVKAKLVQPSKDLGQKVLMALKQLVAQQQQQQQAAPPPGAQQPGQMAQPPQGVTPPAQPGAQPPAAAPAQPMGGA